MNPQQDINKQIEEEYQRFIEFGELLDRQTRKYLVQYLQNKLEPDAFVIPELNDQYYQYFTKALDGLFEIDGLLKITEGNQKITRQIILDTLYWLRKSYQKARSKNPYDSELKRLEGWTVTPLHVFEDRWPFLINFLRTNYAKDQLDIDFYENRFKKILSKGKIKDLEESTRNKLELLLTDLLAQWDALLNAKILEYQLQKLEEEKEAFTQTVEAKVDEYLKLTNLVQPFTEYLGSYWDMSRSLWEDTSFDVLKEYDDLLQDEQSIRELADLLGQLREAEIEMEEETYEKTIIRQEWISDEHSKSEIVGVHDSDDLSNLLSSEAALLSDEDTETLFLKKFAEKNLMTFRYEDRQLVKSEDKFVEVAQRIKMKEKGPFIICMDTSESMIGRPEQIAKVLCLGILKMAVRENRRAYLINFSIGIKTFDLYNVANSIDEIANFLRMSFHGGTDISLPLYEAMNQLRSNDYQDADVLVVSDFIMYRVDKEVLRDVKYFQQNKGTQFHSLTLSDDPNSKILEYFDTNWVYDPKKKGIIKELTRGLADIRNRY
jgi:uncharacterized protein with von Willebrand factor type A (vWA) domain